uniref:Uncharacterized protein n=1 Tax=Cannabis sativa TaxID=3483 RepID=A0A803P3B3_CANSA
MLSRALPSAQCKYGYSGAAGGNLNTSGVNGVQATQPRSQEPVYFNHSISIRLNDHNFLLWKQEVLLCDQRSSPRMVGCDSSQQIWATLETFHSSSIIKDAEFRTKLQNLKKGNLSLNDYLLKVKQTVDLLASVGEVLGDRDHVAAIFKGLPSEYDTFVISTNTRAESKIMQSEIEALLLAESRIEKSGKEIDLSANLISNDQDLGSLGFTFSRTSLMPLKPSNTLRLKLNYSLAPLSNNSSTKWSSERKHRHIVENGLALLAHLLPLKFWDEAFRTHYVTSGSRDNIREEVTGHATSQGIECDEALRTNTQIATRILRRPPPICSSPALPLVGACLNAPGRSNKHQVTTRSKLGIFKPRVFWLQEASSLKEALQQEQWNSAMSDEILALAETNTWILVRRTEGRQPSPTPMTSGLRLSAHQGEPLADVQLYRSIVGALQYLIITRPELSFSVNKVCQFMQRPLSTHWQDVKTILRYISGTMDFGLRFTKPESQDLVASLRSWRAWTDDEEVYLEVMPFSLVQTRLLGRSRNNRPYLSSSLEAAAGTTGDHPSLERFLSRQSQSILELCKSTSNNTSGTTLALNRGKDVTMDNTTKNAIVGKKSFSFLLKKIFVCSSGFPNSPPTPKSPTSEQRMEKILRAILHKKIYPQGSSNPSLSMKKYIENRHNEDDLTDEQKNAVLNGSKWVKTDSECYHVELTWPSIGDFSNSPGFREQILDREEKGGKSF